MRTQERDTTNSPFHFYSKKAAVVHVALPSWSKECRRCFADRFLVGGGGGQPHIKRKQYDKTALSSGQGFGRFGGGGGGSGVLCSNVSSGRMPNTASVRPKDITFHQKKGPLVRPTGSICLQSKESGRGGVLARSHGLGEGGGMGQTVLWVRKHKKLPVPPIPPHFPAATKWGKMGIASPSPKGH